MLLLKRPQKSLFRSPQFHLLRLPSGSICISALVTRTDGCAVHDSFQIKTVSFQNTGLWLSVLLHMWNRCFDRAATCRGAPSRWSASTAVWCLDPHRTSVSLVFQTQTLRPWMQWQRDVITLSMRERQGGREFKVITFAVTTQWQRLGCLWWWAQCVSLWCQIADLRIIYSWVYISNACWMAKLFVLLALGLNSG